MGEELAGLTQRTYVAAVVWENQMGVAKFGSDVYVECGEIRAGAEDHPGRSATGTFNTRGARGRRGVRDCRVALNAMAAGDVGDRETRFDKEKSSAVLNQQRELPAVGGALREAGGGIAGRD